MSHDHWHGGLGSVRVAPCKRVEVCRLRWRPRQSLASRREPSLAWRPVTAVAKRRQGGFRHGTAVNGKIALKSNVIEALTGMRAGQPLSGVNSVRSAHALKVAEGNMDRRAGERRPN